LMDLHLDLSINKVRLVVRHPKTPLVIALKQTRGVPADPVPVL
jgi:hypothetical protein